jgi:hypothetical protein
VRLRIEVGVIELLKGPGRSLKILFAVPGGTTIAGGIVEPNAVVLGGVGAGAGG